MKAIIMAGGEGTRLRPLTCDCPKPMMRLFDKPVMEYSLALLARHGVTEAAVTLGYLPGHIKDYFGDSHSGVSLSYYTERAPLGTAGGVKNAADFLTETFCVLSGDGVTDADLTSALKFHREKNSPATIILKRVPDPMAYGLVITSPDGRIIRFMEKPSWDEVVSDTVNTGIYILEPEILSLIDHTPCDFGRDIFPALAEKGQLYGFTTDGYWCDIGDVSAYLQVHRDALDGRINLPGLPDTTFIHPTAEIAPSAVIEDPVYIGPGAVIGRDARVGPYTSVGQRVFMDDFSGAKRAVLWPGAKLSEGAQARGCVMARSSSLGPCASAFEGSIIGAGATVQADAEVAPDACIWPMKTVPESVRQESNLVWNSSSPRRTFSRGAIPLHTPTEALRFSQAYAAALRPREVLLARTPSAVASAIWHICASGLMAQGVYVLDAGVCTEPQLRYAMSLMRPDGALLADAHSLIPLTEKGLRIPLSAQRAISALAARQDFPQPFSAITHPMALSGRSEHAYIANLAAAFHANAASAPPVAIHSTDPYLLSIAERAFDRTNLSARCEWEEELMELSQNEIGIWLEDGGTRASFSDKTGLLTPGETELIMAWTALHRGETTLAVPACATCAIESVAPGAKILRVPGAQPTVEKALSETSPFQLRLFTDGLFFALSALSALCENSLTLQKWRKKMPHTHRMERAFPVSDARRGAILRELCRAENTSPMEGGISFTSEKGSAWISPDDSRPECLIITESYSAEFAGELCDFCENALRRAAENTPDAL